MAEKIISVKINVDDKSLDQLEGDLKKVGVELQKIETTSTKFSLEDKLQAADGAIKTMAGSLQAVVGTLGLLGIESEKFGDFEKKAASAIALGMGIKDMSEGVGKLAKSWNKAGLSAKLFGTTAKTALVATGIGAFVVLLGTVVAYWDEIVSVVDGVSTAQKGLLETQEASTLEQQKQLDAVSQQENILKLQGKTEREILELKMKETDEVITALEAQVQTQKEVKNAQVAAATRNQMILQGMVRFILAPLTLILGTVDAITAAVSKIPGVGDIATNLEESFSGGIASLIFDPEEVNKKGDEAIQATEDQITKLKNSRAGYQLAVQKIDSDAAQKVKDQQAKTKEESDKAEKDRLKSLEDIRKEYAKRAEDDAAQTNLQKVELEEQRALDALIALGATLEQKKQIEDYYRQLKEAAADEDLQNELDRINQEKIAAAELQAFKVSIVAQAAVDIADMLTMLFEGSKEAAIASVVIEKAASIAGIIANTAVGNAKIVATLGPIAGAPFVLANKIGAGAAIVSTIAAASKAIGQIKNPSSGGGGGSSSIPSGGSVPGGASVNQNLAIEAPQFQPEERAVRTYVLSGDVTSSQEADAKLNRRRSLG